MDFGQHFADNLVSRRRRKTLPLEIANEARHWHEGLNSLRPLMPNGLSLSFWRERALALLIGLGMLLLLGRLFSLQVIQGQKFYILSQENRVYVQNVPAPRGVIYDRKGTVLARNISSHTAKLIYSQLPLNAEEKMTVLKTAQQLLGLSDSELGTVLELAFESPFEALDLKKNLSHSEQLALQSRERDLPGIEIEKGLSRSYPQGEYFASVLGYMGSLGPEELSQLKYVGYSPQSWVGKAGIEAQYEGVLRGEDGRAWVEVAASGEKGDLQERVAPEPGQNLHLSLDAKLQNKVGQLLEEAVATYDATGGIFIALEAKTGEVLAMVNVPSYDNNVFIRGGEGLQELLSNPRGLLVNRATAGLYPPGSTVKPLVGAAALQEGIITAETRVSDEPQVIRIGQWEFPDWTVGWGRSAHGWLNLREAIAESCDIFFYKIGGGFPPECHMSNVTCQMSGLGVGRLTYYLEKFGLGKKTGIDLPEEESGLVPNPEWKKRVKEEPWFLGNTYHLSIGQGDLLATPLQVAHVTNVVANSGRVVTPHLNRDLPVEMGDGLEIYPEHLEEVRRGMRLAVAEGIVYPLRGAKVSVAAKTGTAEFGRKNAKGEWETHAWVSGFAPYEDPEVTFVVLLENGGKSGNAAEVAREIVDWYFTNE